MPRTDRNVWAARSCVWLTKSSPVWFRSVSATEVRQIPTASLHSAAAGSGFLIHPDGYILTAYHVIDRAREIEVRLPDRRRHRARLIGAEPDAEKGKVHPHDVILAINGIQVDTPRELIRVIGGSEAGSKVKLTIFREGEIFDLTVTLGTKPKKVEGREG